RGASRRSGRCTAKSTQWSARWLSSRPGSRSWKVPEFDEYPPQGEMTLAPPRPSTYAVRTSASAIGLPESPHPMPTRISRAAYAGMFGPTTGDRVRLADTDIIIEVEQDFTTYGEEVKFGGGKVIRDGMGQSQTANRSGAVDTVITNALILDHWGIVKA